jgi:glycosyltransferase involved in cell wall biosynthesis
MIHILHVVDSLQVGGAQKMILSFAGEALHRGIPVSVASLADTSGKIPADELAKMGVSVAAFPAKHLADLPRLAALTRYMRSQSFDLVATHLTYGNILGGLAARLAGLPVVATLHSTGNDQTETVFQDFSSPRTRAETFALRYFTNQIIAVGESVAQAQRSRLGNKPIAVIPNAVPQPVLISADERHARRAEIIPDLDQPILISVGRFAPVKELPEMITAFVLLLKQYPEARLILIGDGTERAQVEALIAELHISQNVVLPGRQSNVSTWLQISDLYISSSSLEGMPLSILEAMSVGLPVVATAVGDVPNVLHDGMGLLVPVHEPARLAEAVCDLLDRPELCSAMGAAGRAYVTQDFNIVTWFDRLMTLYENVIGPKKMSSLYPGRLNS